MRFFIETKGFQEFFDKMKLTQQRLRETKPIMAKVALLLYKSVMKNFQEEGTDKEKWAPLSAMTIRMRSKGKGSGRPRILQDTGYLKRSIFPSHTIDEAAVSTNVPYAKLHQFGGTSHISPRTVKPTKKSVLRFLVDGKEVFAKYAKQPARKVEVPARPFMVLRDEYKSNIIDVLRKYINGKD